MKVKAIVRCEFEIEYEDQNDDISYTKENIIMEGVQRLIDRETDESLQYIQILQIEKQ